MGKLKTKQLGEAGTEFQFRSASIYGGQYGSDTENKLEHELDVALEWQQRVSLAKFKWTNGRVLLVHACTQMAFGVKRWQELETIEMRYFAISVKKMLGLTFYDCSNTRARYFAAAEARNNFVAASQNIQSCRVYLGKVSDLVFSLFQMLIRKYLVCFRSNFLIALRTKWPRWKKESIMRSLISKPLINTPVLCNCIKLFIAKWLRLFSGLIRSVRVQNFSHFTE